MQPTPSNPVRSFSQASAWPGSCALLTALLGSLTPAVAQDQLFQPAQLKKEISTNAPSGNPLTDELRWLKAEKMTVTSVSRHAEDPFNAAAAVTVISNEDIRRSGARSIPEALRLAPGMSVAQSQANQWAVASRGFAGGTGSYSDKLLVLVDGRTIYGNLNNGVDWNFRDYPLEDIERIEVIRGPGGTLWGANAVNGVINIITKPAGETQGAYATSGVGIIDRYFGTVRYGAKLSENGYLRFYGSYNERANFPGGNDGSQFYNTGFRADWKLGDLDLSWHGDYFNDNQRTVVAVPSPATPANFFPLTATNYLHWGANTVLTARREFSDESDVQLQTSIGETRKKELGGRFDEYVLDVDFQHRFSLPWHQSVTYGLGYRYYPDRSRDNAIITFDRTERNPQIFSGFIQDEIELAQDRLWATAGTKFEHNDLTGFEYQPSARVRWKPTENQTVWTGVSRAIQMPSASIASISVPILGLPSVGAVPLAFYPFVFGSAAPPGTPGSVPLFLSGHPNPNLQSQELISYELGYRLRPTESVTLDWAGFFNQYNKLITGTFGATTPVAGPGGGTLYGAVPVTAANGGSGESYGFELSAQWEALEWWRLTSSYSLLETHLSAFTSSGQEPESQISLRSTMNLPHDVDLDLWGRYVSRLHSFGIAAYFDFDVRLAWRPTPVLELALVGQNLISPRRNEFGGNVVVVSQSTPVPRAVYAQASVRF